MRSEKVACKMRERSFWVGGSVVSSVVALPIVVQVKVQILTNVKCGPACKEQRRKDLTQTLCASRSWWNSWLLWHWGWSDAMRSQVKIRSFMCNESFAKHVYFLQCSYPRCGPGRWPSLYEDRLEGGEDGIFTCDRGIWTAVLICAAQK